MLIHPFPASVPQSRVAGDHVTESLVPCFERHEIELALTVLVSTPSHWRPALSATKSSWH